MFRKKRKLPKYRFKYGKTPIKKGKTYQTRGFQRVKKKPKRIFRRIGKSLTLALFLAIFILIFYWLFFSGFFKISETKILNESFENEILTEKIQENLGNLIDKNILFTKTENVENQILDSFPELEKITAKKQYPSTLIITFQQYDLVANVINQSSVIKKSYIVNSIGYIVREDFENPSLPYIVIKSDEPINTETQTIETKRLEYILDSMEYFKDKFGMRVIEAEYKPIAREVHLLTEREFKIWLDIQHSFESQLRKLKKAAVRLDVHKENLEYIDLRIAGGSGDKIIYKRR